MCYSMESSVMGLDYYIIDESDDSLGWYLGAISWGSVSLVYFKFLSS